MIKRTANFVSLVVLLACLAALAGPAATQGPIDPRKAPINLGAAAMALKGKGNPQLDSTLNRLVQAERAAAAGATALDGAAEARRLGLAVEGERVLVTLTMADEAAASAAALALAGLGGQVTAQHARWLDVLLPVAMLERAAALPGVSLVHRPIPVFPLAPGAPGSASGESVALENGKLPVSSPDDARAPKPNASMLAVTSEGVGTSNVAAWHAAGYAGQGIKLAVIDGFLFAGDAQAQGELPPTVSIFPPGGGLNMGTDHGTNVAEIIYDMAPGVSMTLASPNFSSCTSMAQYILGLAQAGHKIISSSIGPLHCGAGDGNPANDPIADAAQKALNTYNTLVVQAAGNHAFRHWDGQFTNGTGDLWAEFDTDVTVNVLGSLPAGYPYSIFLRWNGWPVTDQDYDLYLVRFNGTSWDVIDSSLNEQSGTQPPVESLIGSIPQAGTYGIAIYQYDADGQQVLDTLNFYFDLESGVSNRSLVGPSTSPYVFSVAAVDALTTNLEFYSSRGPSHGPGGTLNGGGPQPQIAGFANVSTWVGSVQGSPPFNGTSAATPHVSGAAAVVWSANRCLTAFQVGNFLKSRAVDKGSSGYDYLYGSGVLYLGSPTDELCADPIFLPLVGR